MSKRSFGFAPGALLNVAPKLIVSGVAVPIAEVVPMAIANVGEELKIPIFPLFKILIASVAPLFPVWKIMSAPVVPTPEVERSVRVEVVPLPPINSGPVAEVVNVGVVMFGDVEKTRFVLVVPVAP